MSIGSCYKTNVVTLAQGSSIQDAAKLMAKNNIGTVVITALGQDQKPIGIVTDRDIATKLVAEKNDLDGIKVDDVMSKDLLLIQSDDGITKTIQAMTSKAVRRAPIVENDKLVGIASVDDLVVLLAKEFSDLASLIESQIND